MGIAGNLIAQNVASVLFVILVLMCLHRYSLGKYSYEKYLIHSLLTGIVRLWIRNDVIYVLAVISGTVLIAYVYREGLKRIMKYSERLRIHKMD